MLRTVEPTAWGDARAATLDSCTETPASNILRLNAVAEHASVVAL